MKKIIVIGIIGMFLLVSFPVLSANGSQKWGLIIDLFDDPESIQIKNFLLNGGWDSNNIKRSTTMVDTRYCLNWLINTSDYSDSVFIYINSHGCSQGFGNIGLYMGWAELRKYVDNINAEKIAIWISTCYSGAAIPYLERVGRVIVTSCRGNEFTGPMNSNLLNSMQRSSDYEGNYDGIVTIQEAFNYFYKDKSNERELTQTPQISNKLNGEFELLNIDKGNIYSEEIDVCNLHKLYMSITCGGGYGDFAQTFEPSTQSLSRITVLPAFTPSASYNLYVHIREQIDGNNLATAEVSSRSLTRKVFYDINFHDITFTPGKTYYIVFSSPYCTDLPYNWFCFYITQGGNFNGTIYQKEVNSDKWSEFEPIEPYATNQNLLFITYSTEALPDTTPPVTTCTLSGKTTGSNTFTGSVKVNLSAVDHLSGLLKSMYSINDGPWTEYSTLFTITQLGTYTICYYSIDNAGNQENTKSKTFSVVSSLSLSKISNRIAIAYV